MADQFTLELEDDSGTIIDLDRTGDTPMIRISFPAYKLNAPRKAIEEKETKKDSGLYVIPKAATFVYSTRRLKAPLQSDYASGFRVNLRVDRALSPAKRKAIYDAAKAKGRKIVKAEQGYEIDDLDSPPVAPTDATEGKITRLA